MQDNTLDEATMRSVMEYYGPQVEAVPKRAWDHFMSNYKSSGYKPSSEDTDQPLDSKSELLLVELAEVFRSEENDEDPLDTSTTSRLLPPYKLTEGQLERYPKLARSYATDIATTSADEPSASPELLGKLDEWFELCSDLAMPTLTRKGLANIRETITRPVANRHHVVGWITTTRRHIEATMDPSQRYDQSLASSGRLTVGGLLNAITTWLRSSRDDDV